MESCSSTEKLVGLDAGWIHPQTPLVKESRKSDACTKRILVYFATVLLVVVGYETWQSLRSDYLIQKLEDEKVTLSSAPESNRLRDMAEELESVQFALKEMRERMDQRSEETLERTTELPSTSTIIESIADENTEDWEHEWLLPVVKERSNDDGKPPSYDWGIVSTSQAPKVMIIDEADTKGPVFEPVIGESQIDYRGIPKPSPTFHLGIIRTGDHKNVATPTTTESSPALISDRNEPQESEADITETSVSTAPQTYTSTQSVGLSAISNDPLPEKDVIDSNTDFLREHQKMIVSYLRNEDEEDYDNGYEDYDDEIPSTEYSDAAGHIFKRSIDTASSEGPRKSHSPKKFSHKLAIIRQAVDDENHILQNEVTLASEPAKSILRHKLDDFYRKMEGVSTHIDRLHQRYLEVNGLDDDYVSREFPSDEETLTSNN